MKIRRHTVLATVLLAVGAPVLAACGSSNSHNPAASPTPTPKLPQADCNVIAPLAQGAVAQLTPLSKMPPDQAKAKLDDFINQLRQQEGTLTSPAAKADLDALINALQGANDQQQAAVTVLPAITKIITDCGGVAGS